jgi:hypothetical protein
MDYLIRDVNRRKLHLAGALHHHAGHRQATHFGD